jgi:hypothetical protein
VRLSLAVLGLLVAALGPVAPAAEAQFGTFAGNKIQYRRLDWRVLRGEHVDLHFYPEEDELARVALAWAEDSYAELAAHFRHSVPQRIPLIVYASHADFEQTNLLPFVPPEGLLGFTEFMRSRVALPFRGNYSEFRHTIRHELVHVFQLSRLRLNSALYPRLRRPGIPLWFSEGLAEYWSGGDDTQDEMVLRDLTQRGRLPTIRQLEYAGGGIVYPIGGSLVRFLAMRFGEWRLPLMYDEEWRYDTFEALLEAVFGQGSERLTAEWHHHMRQRYFPQVTGQRPLSLAARQVARSAIKPAVWQPDSGQAQVIYFSPRTGYTNVYAAGLDGRNARVLVKGERSAEFESFHAFDSRLDVSPAGLLVFASRYQDRDALFFMDLARGTRAGRYQFQEIVSILSPAWAPDGRSVVFSGLSLAGYSDLYRLRLPGGELERLTSDRFQDTDPSVSPDGSRVVFSSDRAAGGADGAMNLFVLDLATRRIRPLTAGAWRDRSPRWSADERIVFTSDRRGVADIYAVDSLGAGRRETGVPGGAYDPLWVPALGRYIFGGFEDLSFNVYSIAPPDSALADSLGLEAVVPAPEVLLALAGDTSAQLTPWRWEGLDDGRYARAEAARFDRRMRLDFVGADAIALPGQAAQGATFLLSDLLGDQLVFLNITAVQGTNRFSDLLGGIHGSAVYINQTDRLNWGVGAFRYRGRFFDGDFNRRYDETTAGGFFLLRYPLSRFERIEGMLRVEHSDRTDLGFNDRGELFPRRAGVLTSNYLSYVRDNTLWMATGPIDGARVSLTGGIVNDLRNARLDSWLVTLDARQYLRTSLYSAVALRGYGFISGGPVPDRIAIGGTHALRGYPRYQYVSGTRALMANLEWRFPLTDYLSLGLPVGEWRFPGIQGAFFADIGRAWSVRTTARGSLGSYGTSLRMPIAFPIVLRLDLGWRWHTGALERYNLPRRYRPARFASLWLGFNY